MNFLLRQLLLTTVPPSTLPVRLSSNLQQSPSNRRQGPLSTSDDIPKAKLQLTQSLNKRKAETVRFGPDQEKKLLTIDIGCSTCKEKRLKCDETHPSCLQCKKRNVDCGGYKKTFTFRTVQKDNFPQSTAPRPRKSKSDKSRYKEGEPAHLNSGTTRLAASANATAGDRCLDTAIDRRLSNGSEQDIISSTEQSSEDFGPSLSEFNLITLPSSPESTSKDLCPPSLSIRDSGEEVILDESHGEPTPLDPSSPVTPRFSPDVLFHDAGTSNVPSVYSIPTTPCQLTSPIAPIDPLQSLPFDPEMIDFDDIPDIDDIISQEPDSQSIVPRTYPSPPLTQPSSPLEIPFGPSPNINLDPEFSGFLHLLFHDHTCGILSIKNGLGENPWWNLLWPMAFTDAALYYSTLAMTASHAASSRYPALRHKALALQTTGIHLLQANMSKMRSDTALATALVLAFAESWHSHIYSGIIHLRGARRMILQGLEQQASTEMDAIDQDRMQFLQSTWVYMDVIARLTALGGDDPEDLDSIVLPTMYGPEAVIHEIDPLMGCATTLFPLIGAIASLIKEVRKSRKTLLQTITRAAVLRDQVIKWEAPARFNPPRDETLEIDHSRHTAEAYKYATILYLYQAVPMVCTEEPSKLAKETLLHLAAVPDSSRATIIHIFPLLAAGCEASSAGDRAFVEERWAAMRNRMCIGNLDRCWDVVKEVWNRRDDVRRRSPGWASPHSRRQSFQDTGSAASSRPHSPLRAEEIKTCSPRSIMERDSSNTSRQGSKEKGPGNKVKIDPEMTVRGPLHWVAVMTEKKWESTSCF